MIARICNKTHTHTNLNNKNFQYDSFVYIHVYGTFEVIHIEGFGTDESFS